MQAQHYFDITARGSNNSEGAVTALPVITRLYAILHGIMRENPGQYALAFPAMKPNAEIEQVNGKSYLKITALADGEYRHPGNRLRVFAESQAALEKVKNDLIRNERIHGYVSFGDFLAIPPEYSGAWREYRRYRIPNQRSRLQNCREARLQAADNLPFIRFTSKGNGHGFILHIACIDGQSTSNCSPDGYGLSRTDSSFCLPMPL